MKLQIIYEAADPPHLDGGAMSVPKCFISYSWDTDAHKDWVRHLAEQLQRNGVKVLLDRWDLKPGADLLSWMETSIRESDFVVLVCTPQFAEKANCGYGVWATRKGLLPERSSFAPQQQNLYLSLGVAIPRTACLPISSLRSTWTFVMMEHSQEA